MTLTVLRTFLVATVCATIVHAQGPATRMPAGANVLVGRVVEMGTNRPVGGAIVSLTGHFDASGKPATPNPAIRGDIPPSLNVMTTSGGDFVFRDLPAGVFTAAVRAFGYVNSDFPPTLVELSNSQKPTEVRLHVWKYAAIGGRVLDEQGEPIAGIPVNALQRVTTGTGTLLRRAGIALTDDRGEYRITGLVPGEYVASVLSTTTTLPETVAAALNPSPANRTASSAARAELSASGFFRTIGCPTCVSSENEGLHVDGFLLQRPGISLPPAPDGRPLSFANTFYPGTSRADEATVIALGSGESRSDLDLVVRLAPSVRVTGVLTGPDGPMPHGVLRMVPPGADLNDFDAVGVATAITDTNGAFTFLGVVPGDYTLSSALQPQVQENGPEARPLWASQSLSVGGTGMAGLAIVMRPGARINGRAEFRSASGVMTEPPSRQIIFLQPVGAVWWRTLLVIVRADGTFRSAGDPPGRYVVNAASPMPGWFWQTTTMDGKLVPDEVIELGSSEVSGLVITFGQTTNRVSGRVIDPAGAPDPDAAVIVFPADSEAWRQGTLTNRRVRKVHTTSAGSFDVATLAPGEYYVSAISTRLALNWTDARFLDSLVGGATRVTLGAEDQKTMALRTLVASERER